MRFLEHLLEGIASSPTTREWERLWGKFEEVVPRLIYKTMYETWEQVEPDDYRSAEGFSDYVLAHDIEGYIEEWFKQLGHPGMPQVRIIGEKLKKLAKKRPMQEGFAKRTYRQRKANQTVQALADEYIDMVETHGGIDEMGFDEGAWGAYFDMLMEHLADSYATEVIKKVKEHYV